MNSPMNSAHSGWNDKKQTQDSTICFLQEAYISSKDIEWRDGRLLSKQMITKRRQELFYSYFIANEMDFKSKVVTKEKVIIWM